MRYSDWLCASILMTSPLLVWGTDMSEFLQAFRPIQLQQKIIDTDGAELFRKKNVLGTLPDQDFKGLYDLKAYKYNDTHTVEEVRGNFHRGKGDYQVRGSKQNVDKRAQIFEHQPFKEDPQGCGNPVCVVIDKKPRRFRSLCRLIEFLMRTSRKEMVHFVQKGDCYDIIDNNEGAKEKKWSQNAVDCSACLKDPLCKQKVSFIIDIQSVIKGESSARGGPTLKESEQGGLRAAAFPFYFDNVCAAMQMFEKLENINVKTQVVGFAFGNCKPETLFNPTGGDKCLWTEYFDHHTPCTSDRDTERHSDHYMALRSSDTGVFRICSSDNIISTQHEGGSEITRVSADMCAVGQCVGTNSTTPFKQVLQYSKTALSCLNSENKGTVLPPPFIYADDRNVTCLDYKTRYCCKTGPMYRPVYVSSLTQRLGVYIPIGLAVTTVTLTTANEITDFKIYISDGNPKILKTIEMRLFGQNDVSGVLTKENYVQQAIRGSYTLVKRPDNSRLITITIRANDKPSAKTVGIIEIELHPSPAAKIAVSTVLKCLINGVIATTTMRLQGQSDSIPSGAPKLYQGSSTSPPFKPSDQGSSTSPPFKASAPEKYVSNDGSQYNFDKPREFVAELIDKLNGKKTIISKFQATIVNGGMEILNETGQLNVLIDIATTDIWEKVTAFVNTYGITFLVDSPPLATLFWECEWKDYVNQDYPDREKGLLGEFELRDRAVNNTKWKEHVCGSTPEHAHYVDAITMEDQLPWNELNMVGTTTYETFKLTPFFGYACKDLNGPEGFCVDMKVRYCCEKSLRATWGEWEEWSTCSATCGGGEMTRVRLCLVNQSKKNSNGYISTCYGQEETRTSVDRARFTSQKELCNLSSCPKDSNWGIWTAWSACSITCGAGTKERSRTCSPPVGGGADCPDRNKNAFLYLQNEACTQKDCEQSEFKLWSSWSSCSATCGQGVKTRKRDCYSVSTLQVVSQQSCSNEPSHFNQQDACSLGTCPVDGGWTVWNSWGLCSQRCIHHPDNKKAIHTKASRARVRYCTNPIPAFQGKDCQKDPKFIYQSTTNSEEDRTSCITEQTENKSPTDIVTDWCPENCIFSEWGSWGACSETCIKARIDVGEFNGKDNLVEFLEYHVQDITAMPKRSRMRVLVKPERFNGECWEMNKFNDIPSSYNGSVQYQDQECTLCKEHCMDKTLNPNTDTRTFPKLTYPHEKDPRCVGYCPASCEWLSPIPSAQCTVNQEQYFKDKKAKYDKMAENSNSKISVSQGNCFVSESLVSAVENSQPAAKAKIETLLEVLAKSTDNKDFEKMIREYTDSITPLVKSGTSGNMFKEKLYLFGKDINELKKLVFLEEQKYIKPPIYDGLFGGTDCFSPVDNKTVTSNKEKAKGEQYVTDPFFQTYRKNCKIDLCMVTQHTKKAGPAQTCTFYHWAEWGPWASCKKECGNEGTRDRKRVCLDTCTMKEVGSDKKSKCSPEIYQGRNKTWTDTYTGPCTPCPPNKQGSWSTWTEWSLNGLNCFDDSKGSGARGTIDRVRERVCIEGENIKKCPPSPLSGKTEGKEFDKISLALPACGGYAPLTLGKLY